MKLVINKKSKDFNESFLVDYEHDFFKVKFKKNYSIYMNGNIYYNKDDESVNLFKDSPTEIKGLGEGCYAIFRFDKQQKKITVFNDKLCKKEIYYQETDKQIIIATDLNAFNLESCEPHEEVLTCCMLLYPPKRHTIYKGIKRLGYNEYLCYHNHRLQLKHYTERPIEIKKYTDNDLKKYYKIVENAILSRASEDDINVVQISGGWDSTLLLAILLKHFDKDKIKPVVFHMILPDGSTYNPHELEKCRQICTEHYGLTLDEVDVNLGDEKLVDYWKNNVQDQLTKYQLYGEIMINQFKLADYVKNKYGEDVVVFNGEGCDSLHNFGFSQYMTMTHDDYGFREYADKMMNYIYSPSFFKKILDNSYQEDIVFKIIREFTDYKIINYKGNNLESRVFDYLYCFVFRGCDPPYVISEKGIDEDRWTAFQNWVKKEYFDDIIKIINPKNFYYCLMRLYIDFHLQGYSIRKLWSTLPNMRIPFMDSELFDFLASAPENWGRGLDLNHTKYSLKKMIEATANFPIEIVKQDGHSYITEKRTDVNYYEEYLKKSPLGKYFHNINGMELFCGMNYSKIDYNYLLFRSHNPDVKVDFI